MLVASALVHLSRRLWLRGDHLRCRHVIAVIGLWWRGDGGDDGHHDLCASCCRALAFARRLGRAFRLLPVRYRAGIGNRQGGGCRPDGRMVRPGRGARLVRARAATGILGRAQACSAATTSWHDRPRHAPGRCRPLAMGALAVLVIVPLVGSDMRDAVLTSTPALTMGLEAGGFCWPSRWLCRSDGARRFDWPSRTCRAHIRVGRPAAQGRLADPCAGPGVPRLRLLGAEMKVRSFGSADIGFSPSFTVTFDRGSTTLPKLRRSDAAGGGGCDQGAGESASS